jgi:BirA family biotin operon repressor/biotin-[acetyl-CoA-carboxylase] ligase
VSEERLIAVLADGAVHSGEALAASAGVTRAAIWKQVSKLAALGIEVERVPGRGYRVPGGLDLLDATAIRAALDPAACTALGALEVLRTVGSTNTRLMEQTDAPRCAVCLAEHQSGGRGRMGRRWTSPFGANLYASVSWTFEALPPGIQALALAAGAVLVGTLDSDGRRGLALKWPNDLVVGAAKLGGILVELRGEPPGRTRAVVGIGINLRMPAASAGDIDQPWTDLATLDGHPPDRNRLAAAVVGATIAMLARFEREGFAPFAERWGHADALRDRPVRVAAAGTAVEGVARGIDRDGALRVETSTGIERMLAGEVSVRAR